MFVAGWTHAVQSEWPFINIIIKQCNIDTAVRTWPGTIQVFRSRVLYRYTQLILIHLIYCVYLIVYHFFFQSPLIIVIIVVLHTPG